MTSRETAKIWRRRAGFAGASVFFREITSSSTDTGRFPGSQRISADGEPLSAQTGHCPGIHRDVAGDGADLETARRLRR
ncbi:MAG TPA: hypothetical protein VIW92_08880, partial [Thermoanaerobaculia bacterium]